MASFSIIFEKLNREEMSFSISTIIQNKVFCINAAERGQLYKTTYFVSVTR